jgi:hypothetical protein
MATRILGPTGRRWLGYMLGPILLAVVLFVAGAQAVHDDGVFELDKNAVATSTNPNDDDWNQVFAVANSTDPDCSTLGAVECAFVNDPQDATIFTGGGSKDDLDIPSWRHKSGSVPPKDEITNAYAALYEVPGPGGDQHLYFGADRFANNGSADFGFWFFRNEVSLNPDGTFNGVHEVGDVLILGTFTQGGATTTIRVFEWTGTTVTQTDVFGDCVPGSSGDQGCGTVNSQTEVAPWPYTPKFGTTGTFPSGSFFEGGVNLSELGLAGCFSSFLAETRSSPSVDATLKDFVLGQFAPCEANIVTTPSDTSITLGESVSDHAVVTGAGPGAPVPTGTVSFHICSPLELDNGGTPADPSDDTCPTGGTAVNGASGAAEEPLTPTGNPAEASADSAEFEPTLPGRWCWRGDYTPAEGSPYDADSDSSTGECLQVVTIPTTISTDQKWTPNDSATVSTQTGTLSGSVTFTLYGPGDSDCNGTIRYQETVDLAGGSASETVSTTNGDGSPATGLAADFDVTEANDGTYSWLVEYDSGDVAHEDSSSACHVEHSDLTITEPAEP